MSILSWLKRKPKLKAYGIISGGLDSTLAALIVKRLGVEVRLLYCRTGYPAGRKTMIRGADSTVGAPAAVASAPHSCLPTGRHGGEAHLQKVPPAVERAVDLIRAPLEVADISGECLRVLLEPKHGYGSAANPCIDCHVAMLREAARRLEKWGGDFVFSGEVAGQRPKSQRIPTLRLVEKEAGLEGRLVRPLSQKLLPPSALQEEGKLDGEKLYGISGRSRAGQMRLAEEFGLKDYPSPAGGCLVTDKNFAARFFDFKDKRRAGQLVERDLFLLALGRHFRIDDETKLIVGREAAENELLEKHAGEDMLLEVNGYPGPTSLLQVFESANRRDRETANKDSIHVAVELAAAITVRYSDCPKGKKARVKWWGKNGEGELEDVSGIEDGDLEKMRV